MLGGIILALLRSKLWFLGALAGGCVGFLAGWRWHRPALFRKKPNF